MKKLAVGIDIGGTNTAIGIVDALGNVYYHISIPTQTRPKIEDYIADICQEIELGRMKISDAHTLVGIGIGAPNGNYYQGTIENAPNLRWKGVIEFTKMFSKYYKIPIYLTNDANAAALGEMVYGGAKNMSNFAVITLGTGLGSGIVVNGKLLYGHDGFAGEMGHVIVKPNGRLCGCGRLGCLETYVSATGLVRTTYELMAELNQPTDLQKIPYHELTAFMVAQAADRNDPIAKMAFSKTAQALGEAIANLVVITSPEAIFLFGGLTKAGSILMDQVKYHMDLNMLSVFKNKTKLFVSELGDNAAILGSSALVWAELK